MMIAMMGVALLATMLLGCSSMKKKGDPSALRSTSSSEFDQSYVSRVNRQANERGNAEIWINPPQADSRSATAKSD